MLLLRIKMLQLQCIVFLLVSLSFECILGDGPNFIATNYTNCAPNSPIKLDITFNHNQKQLLNISLDSPYNIDATFFSVIDIFKIINSNRIKLVTLRNNKGICDHLDDIIGPMWHELQKRMSLVPGSCPIPKGKYRVFNHRFNFKNMRISGLPLGELAACLKAFNKVTGKLVLCGDLSAESK